MRRAIAWIFPAVLAAASAGSAAKTGTDPYAGIHSIGVISAIGHSVALKNVGMTVFSNSEEPIPADDWQLDETALAIISSELSARFTITPIVADKTAFSTPDTSWFFGSSVPLERLVSQLPPRSDIDAYLVLYPTSFRDPAFQTNQDLRGLGLYRHLYGFEHALVAYAFYDVSVVDAHTGKIIKGQVGHVARSGIFASGLPFVPCQESVWSDTAAQMREDQKQTLRLSLISLIKWSLPQTLVYLDLSQEAVTPVTTPSCTPLPPWSNPQAPSGSATPPAQPNKQGE
jgi:hypothetical protein